MKEIVSCDVLILGGGVIGLAVASKLEGRETILVEAHDRFGCETSSRNSEVVHSGIHYPIDSWKTRMCIEGREKLYAYCQSHGVPIKACGKLVIASSEDPTEAEKLETIATRARELDVPVENWGAKQVSAEEPLLKAGPALLFPKTGIVDSHSLMGSFEKVAREAGAMLAYRHCAQSFARRGAKWVTKVEGPDGPFEIESQAIVNAAGLAAAKLSNDALETNRFEHRFCRGRYFSLSAKYRNRFRRLVYPVPQTHGLGVHTTIDLEGFARLGPDVDWCETSDPSQLSSYYQCDWDSLRASFLTAARKLLPSCEAADLTPGTIGIRPKLFIDGKPFSDFLIEENQGWIHCLGIESPGLTSSIAIADRVLTLLP